MVDNKANKHTADEQPQDVESLRVERDKARAAGDTARVQQLEQQLRQAGAE